MKDRFFLALLTTQRAHFSRSRRGFQELNLSDGQPNVLYVLRDNEGCVQKELAGFCQITPPSMAVMLEKLEDLGYVRREATKVSGGKRAYKVYLTEEGKIMADKVHALMEEIELECFQGFSTEEYEQLITLLERVKNNLS
ncbi:MAG: MarR family transcriptional regulator [Lachnospiraceae bacterium]|nr:MarR family transcriptional regulator [Lachnospiraceae bacterium]